MYFGKHETSVQCWASAVDSGLTLNHCWVNVPLLAGLLFRFFLTMYRSCKQETHLTTGLIIAQRSRRWPSNNSTLDQRLFYMGHTFPDIGDIIYLHMYLIPYVHNDISYGRNGEEVQMAGMSLQ